MRVRDIMSRPVHTVRATDPIETTAALLSKYDITAAPVVDDQGALMGMVSESDLLRRRVPSDPTAQLWNTKPDEAGPRPEHVADVMTRTAVTAWPGQDLAEAARTMMECDVRSLPVVDNGEVVGIISRRDILRSVVRTDDVLRHDVQHRLDEYGDGHRWSAQIVDGVATVDGRFDDEIEQKVVQALVRTTPGIRAVRFTLPLTG